MTDQKLIVGAMYRLKGAPDTAPGVRLLETAGPRDPDCQILGLVRVDGVYDAWRWCRHLVNRFQYVGEECLGELDQRDAVTAAYSRGAA